MNLNYTKTNFSLSVKAFFVKMYLLIKSIIANFYEKISEKSESIFREITFSKLANSPTNFKESQGFDNLLLRTFSRFFSRSSYRDIEKSLMFLCFILPISSSTFAQYVHPNQAGRKGGDTGPGIGNQVVTSTYLGNAGNILAQGVIMSVNKDGTNAASFHDFDGYPGDGSYPFYTTPHQASNGKLYGSTLFGGTSNWGAVYDYDFSTCSENVIFNNGQTPGSLTPSGGVLNYANVNELSDGKIYSVQTYGGAYALGAIYRMDKDGSNQELIHSFSFSLSTLVNYSTAASAQATYLAVTYPKYDGAHPYGFAVEGADGKIYGTCYDGGAYARGAVYRCNKDGSNYEVINVGSPFLRSDYKNGSNATITAYNMSFSWGNVAQDQAGKIYMVATIGGLAALGGVARMDADGSNYQIIHQGSAADGYYPYRGVTIIDNKVYGTYRYGGTGLYGDVWSANLDGTSFTKIYSFPISTAEGGYPWAGVSYDGTHLFGTTLVGGGIGKIGTIFKIKPDGTDFQTLHRFSNTQATPNCGGSKGGLWTYYPSAERVTFANVSLNCNKTCIVNPAPCTANNVPPTLLATTLSNVCSATTANLTSLSSGNAGTVTWHTAFPATYANRVLNVTAVSAGTYYASFYDATNDCYSTAASAAVTVTINQCSTILGLSASSKAITTPVDIAKTGNAATDLSPQGLSPFSYTSVDCTTSNTSIATAQGGTVSVSSTTGAYTYTPPTGYTGLDSFCVKICDGNTPQLCKKVTYSVTVTPANCDARGTVPQN